MSKSANLGQHPAEPGTVEWTERHRSVVSASQIAMLFGVPVYGGRTVSDLWYEKKYGTVCASKGNKSTSLGSRLEPVLLDLAEEKFGEIVERQAWYSRDLIGATLDGRVSESGEVIEAKTSGIVGPSKLAEWGEDGSDECPDQYLLQVQAQLFVTGAEAAHIVALIGGRGFATFTVEPQPSLFDAMQSKAEAFIASLSSDVAPTEPPQLETLKRLKRQPHSIVRVPHDLVDEYREVTASAKAADAEKERVQRLLLAALGDAEAGDSGDGLWTYYEQSRKGFTVEPSTFRVLRFKKN